MTKRRIMAVLVLMLLMSVCSNAVLAQGIDLSKSGSISVTLVDKNENEPMVGAELSVYYVASVEDNVNGELYYSFTEAFNAIDAKVDDSDLAGKVDAYVDQNNVPAVKIITDEEGTAVYRDTALGLYFVKQTNAVDGFSNCTPFLVTVPTEEADGLVYDVNATPKTEAERFVSITIKKIWNTDESTEAADHVTVQLLRDGSVIKTATLNEQNNWQVTYPNMPADDGYSIEEINIPQGFTATYSNSGYSFTVTNSSTLIQTGQLIWPIPVLAAVGIVLVVIGVVLLQKKRNRNA